MTACYGNCRNHHSWRRGDILCASLKIEIICWPPDTYATTEIAQERSYLNSTTCSLVRTSISPATFHSPGEYAVTRPQFVQSRSNG